MTKDEALRLALEALELVNIEFVCGNGSHNAKKDRHEWDETCPITNRSQKAIAALKEALAQPEQEPVAWMNDSTPSGIFARHREGAKNFGCTIPLYTTPPQRTWVGLTRTELIKCGVLPFGMSYELCKAIEAQLKDKNNG